MPNKWKTITLPSELIEEIKTHIPSYMSLSEFVRNAIRFYIDEKYHPHIEKMILEVPAIE